MIKRNIDIERIIKKKVRVGNNYFVIYQEINETKQFRFAISIGKKYGNAVMRNKMKRRIREIVKKTYLDFLNRNIIIVVKKESNKLSFEEIQTEILSLFNKLKEKR